MTATTCPDPDARHSGRHRGIRDAGRRGARSSRGSIAQRDSKTHAWVPYR
jgi:hypothetical protein